MEKLSLKLQYVCVLTCNLRLFLIENTETSHFIFKTNSHFMKVGKNCDHI